MGAAVLLPLKMSVDGCQDIKKNVFSFPLNWLKQWALQVTAEGTSEIEGLLGVNTMAGVGNSVLAEGYFEGLLLIHKK